jgi:acetate kinase
MAPMKVLVLNCGSSSLKFQIIEPATAANPGGQARRLARGLIDRIGDEATCTFLVGDSAAHRETASIRNHAEAVRRALAWLGGYDAGAPGTVDAVGHRVVHGGDRFAGAVLIDEDVMAAIEGLHELAPLHNPPALSAIRAARAVLGPSVPMVAVFDTAFHRTIPDYAGVYAIPHELSARYKVRRYGFHGIAHQYLALRYAEVTATPYDRVNIITFHLGNGCSASAIQGGRSVDTSMGFTPLEGLVMGTRSGDLDPALVGYLASKEAMAVAEVETLLNERSGLLGVSGLSNDMRVLVEHAHHDPRARLAIDIFCYRAKKYLGAYLAALGGADAIVFSGGIGEHAPVVRARICEGLGWCGLVLDPGRNAQTIGSEGRISSEEARLHAYVIPVDEELLIAEETIRCLQGYSGGQDDRARSKEG